METDGKLNPRDSYGKLVISTFNAFRKCEQRAKLAKIDTEASEQRAERAILLWQFKREDDIKAAEDAKKKAKREKEKRQRWERLNMRRRRECAAKPYYRDSKPEGTFEATCGEWGA